MFVYNIIFISLQYTNLSILEIPVSYSFVPNQQGAFLNLKKYIFADIDIHRDINVVPYELKTLRRFAIRL